MQNLPIAAANFALPLSLGNIDAYVQAANRYPMLSQEEEKQLAEDFLHKGDVEAAKKLVLSHLRLVISVARGYLGYGLPHADLIQEGNIGLMKAVKRFDPAVGVRLFSYAIHWIKAEIHGYILKNWRLVKITMTKSNRKLFFNLRSLKAELSNKENLDPSQAKQIATTLGVKPQEVLDMEIRLSGHEIALEDYNNDDGEQGYAPINYLADNRYEPQNVIAEKEFAKLSGERLTNAIVQLDPRSQKIIKARWLNDEKNSTLHELAAELSLSHERIRQIEAAALIKLKKFLVD